MQERKTTYEKRKKRLKNVMFQHDEDDNASDDVDDVREGKGMCEGGEGKGRARQNKRLNVR